jgi:hypothetical protein
MALLFSFTVTVLTTLVPALTVILSFRLLSFRKRLRALLENLSLSDEPAALQVPPPVATTVFLPSLVVLATLFVTLAVALTPTVGEQAALTRRSLLERVLQLDGSDEEAPVEG